MCCFVVSVRGGSSENACIGAAALLPKNCRDIAVVLLVVLWSLDIVVALP